MEAYDKFVSQARHHNADAPIAVVVAGPPSESADHAAELTRIVASRWVDANILTIYLDGPGTAPMMGAPATPLWAEDESFQLPDNLDALAGIIVAAVPSPVTSTVLHRPPSSSRCWCAAVLRGSASRPVRWPRVSPLWQEDGSCRNARSASRQVLRASTRSPSSRALAWSA
ncbi:hypothetical protein JCM18918_2576 [Cutibacterium acnes JCM 18918]|nr:hypothetical protein JCM18918_2576 [Cutibacterium acnes JCM 18918]